MDIDYWYVAGYQASGDVWIDLEYEGNKPEPYYQPFDSFDGDFVLAVVDDDGVTHYATVHDGWDLDYPIELIIEEYDWEIYT